MFSIFDRVFFTVWSKLFTVVDTEFLRSPRHLKISKTFHFNGSISLEAGKMCSAATPLYTYKMYL